MFRVIACRVRSVALLPTTMAPNLLPMHLHDLRVINQRGASDSLASSWLGVVGGWPLPVQVALMGLPQCCACMGKAL